MFTSFSATSFAQLGKMQFEDAEQAFSEGKFEEAIQFLNEAEKSLRKTNPPIMHLRILSMTELVKKDPEKDFDIIDKLRKEVNLFLKQYESDARLEDKYRDVYQVSKVLAKLPATRQEFDRKITEERLAAQNKAKENKEKQERFQLYSYIAGHKNGLTIEDVWKSIPSIQKKHYKIMYKRTIHLEDGYKTWYNYAVDSSYYLYLYNDKTAGYKTTVYRDESNTYEKGKQTLAEKKAYFTDLFGFEPEETEKQYPSGATGTWYTWQSGNKTFRLESLFYQDNAGKYVSKVEIFDIDKS
jgi:hypothetical protein